MSDERLRNLAKGFDQAAKSYGNDPNTGFDHFGELLTEFSQAAPGEHVLDVACGTGAISLPLSRRIGPAGRLLGVDISNRMMSRAKKRIDAEGITWVEIQQHDAGELNLDERFDLATCGFSVQFFNDRHLPIRRMIEHLKPGGRVAISLWAEDYDGRFLHLPHDAVKRVRPDIYEPPRAGTVGGTEAKMVAFLAEAGLKDIVAQRQDFDTVDGMDGDSWWERAAGGGFQRLLVQLTPGEVEEVRTWLVAEREKLRSADGKFHVPKPAILGMGWA